MTDHIDARQLLADITAGLEGVTPGPWKFDGYSITDWGREWEASMSMEFIPNGTNEDGINERYEKDGTHIARCDPDTMQAIADLVATQAQRIAELEAERQWQPIETAPKDWTDVLLYVPDEDDGSGSQGVVKGWYSMADVGLDLWVSAETNPPGLCKPTHWMPLPASPQEGTQS